MLDLQENDMQDQQQHQQKPLQELLQDQETRIQQMLHEQENRLKEEFTTQISALTVTIKILMQVNYKVSKVSLGRLTSRSRPSTSCNLLA